MAITQDDFKKVWASTSSVPEYTFSDADYQDGWEFVGNLPPTRAMWDTLQRRNDEKMQFLQENGSMCFDSVADMKSSNLDAGQTALTKGYYSVNDGGSSIYTIRAKTQNDVEDGGSIIFLDNGNVAELIADDTVNVKQFGAKGDGVTDDTTPFNNALTYANGKILNVQKGNYLINTNLFADGIKEVIDEGAYVNIKPVYPVKKLLVETNELITMEASIALDSGYTSTQGMCYNTKTKRLIVAEKQDGDASATHTQKLLVVDPLSNYNVDNSYTYTELKHCNSMTYCPDDNKIYVESFIVDSGSASDFNIVVIDADTMGIVDTISLTSMPHDTALSYDQRCKMFVLGGANKLYLYDKNFNYIKTVDVPDDGLMANGMVALDGQVVLFKLGSIEVFDLFGNLNKRMLSPSNLEAEDICWDGAGTFHINYNILDKIVLAKYSVSNVSNRPTAKGHGEAILQYTNINANKLNFTGVFYVDNTSMYNYGHLPCAVAIVRTYYSPGYIKQIAYEIGSPNEHKMYTREWIGGSWSNWSRVDGKQIVVESKKFNSNTLNANTYTSLSLDMSKTGLTPIGVAGYNIATTYNLNATACYFNATNSSVEMRVYNPGAATTTNVTIYGLYLTN